MTIRFPLSSTKDWVSEERISSYEELVRRAKVHYEDYKSNLISDGFTPVSFEMYFWQIEEKWLEQHPTPNSLVEDLD